MDSPRHWLDRMLLCDEVAGEVATYQAEQQRSKAGRR